MVGSYILHRSSSLQKARSKWPVYSRVSLREVIKKLHVVMRYVCSSVSLRWWGLLGA